MSGVGVQGAQGTDLVAVLRSYVDRMLREVPGMKVLLLDSETTRVVSTVFSQSEILEQEVYLVERLEADKGDQLFDLNVRWEQSSGQATAGSSHTAAAPAATNTDRPAALRSCASPGCLFSAADPREHCTHKARAAGSPLWRVPPV